MISKDILDSSKRLTLEKIAYILDVYQSEELRKTSIKLTNGILYNNIPFSVHDLLYEMLSNSFIAEDENLIYIIKYTKSKPIIQTIIPKKPIQFSFNTYKSLIDTGLVKTIAIIHEGLEGDKVTKVDLGFTFLYDNSILSLSGRKFRKIRAQLNKVNSDIAEGKLEIIRFSLDDISDDMLSKIHNINNKWKDSTSHLVYWKSVSEFNEIILKKSLLKHLHVTVIMDKIKDTIITFGISHLAPFNLIHITEGKRNYDYSHIYPDINKLLIYLEVENIINKYNLNKDLITFCLGTDYITDSVKLGSDYISFKENLSSGQMYKCGSYFDFRKRIQK